MLSVHPAISSREKDPLEPTPSEAMSSVTA